MIDAILWVLQGMWSGVAGVFYVLANLGTVLDFSDKENIMRVIFYGASSEFFFVFFNTVLIVFVIGIFSHRFLWAVVVGLEGFSNIVGRTAAWAGLIMVLQQILVVFLQAIFRVSDISVGPFGLDVTMPVGWYADGLKLHNAIIVTLCCAYTFTQRGHVRVDLIYAAVSHRTKRAIDMFGSLFFMMPAMLLTWFYAWFFLWRHLITPKVNSTDTLERTLLKAKAMRWNVETIGFSPNGFNAYFLFKVLLVLFCFMMLVQAVAFFYRSYLEFTEGPESADKYFDKDRLGDEDAELVAQIH